MGDRSSWWQAAVPTALATWLASWVVLPHPDGSFISIRIILPIDSIARGSSAYICSSRVDLDE
jgi:hypothetical protein